MIDLLRVEAENNQCPASDQNHDTPGSLRKIMTIVGR